MDVLTVLVVTLLRPNLLYAQEYSDFSELDQIEAELEKNKIQKKESSQVDNEEKMTGASNTSKEITNISDLRTLESFSEMAIIHPRFQPKGKRFQVHFGGATLLNDPWFNQFGASFKAAYHFSDLFGLELATDFYSGSESNASRDLFESLSVSASSFVRPQSYSGLHIYLSPIYGKMSLFNKRIVPYDVYFTLGAGSTTLEQAKEKQADTFHLGAGQIFAFSRNAAFRWDIRVNAFSAQGYQSSAKKIETQNVIMTLGFSYFLPEVSSR
jgi:outer membrane beta-barrel protein